MRVRGQPTRRRRSVSSLAGRRPGPRFWARFDLRHGAWMMLLFVAVGASLLGLGALTSPVSAASAGPAVLADGDAGAATSVALPKERGPDVVLFHGEGCAHCADEREFLADLRERRADLTVAEYEVWYDESNRALLAEYEARLGFTAQGVPVTIVGDRVWIGFSDSIAAQIEQALPAPGDAELTPEESAAGPSVDVPLVGTMSLAGSSLVTTTVVIAFVDGVNPCSLWVLSVLLAIVLRSGSRRRVMLVGVTFLTITAGMYGLYIVGFYSALDYLDQMVWIRIVVAAIAGTFGVLQLLDGLAPGRAPSLSISADAKPRLYRRMRRLSRPDQSLPSLLGGTAVLAVGVSLLETPCTAGLPLLWTSLLADQGVPRAEAVALFAIYLLVFLIDELLLFGAAVITMRATRVQERHGRALKILAGSVLVTLAVTMIVAPQALTSPVGSLVVFGTAGLLSALLWWASARSARSREPVPPG